MLDVGGNCSIAFLRRSFAGSKRQCILFAWRRGHQRRGAMRACAGPAVPRTFHAALAAPRGSIFHQEAMTQLCGAGPCGS